MGEGQSLISIGGSFAMRLNQPRYDLYNDRVWRGYIGFQHASRWDKGTREQEDGETRGQGDRETERQGDRETERRGQRTIRLGYTVTSRIYPNAEAFSSVDHELSTSIGRTWPTRTSIRLDGNIGYRRYRSRESDGQGMMLPDQGMVGGGMGSGMGPGRTPMRGDTRAGTGIQAQARTQTQIVAAIRVSQSLTDAVGFGVRYLRRINLSEEARLLQTPLLGDLIDDGLFNDRYTYSGPEVTGTLSVVLPLDFDITLEGGRLIRSYDGTSREDRRTLFSAQAGKTFPLSLSNDLTVDLTVSRYINTSTDPYFTYRTTVISLSFGAEL
jgi:hypothetical protein